MKATKKNTFITFENLLGLILTLLILFEFDLEPQLKNVLNTPVGVVISLVLLVLIFIFMNPIVGLLFLIYLYESVRQQPLLNLNYLFNQEYSKTKILNNMNLGNKDKVEIEVIQKMGPIVRKPENINSRFVPNIDSKFGFEKI